MAKGDPAMILSNTQVAPALSLLRVVAWVNVIKGSAGL